MKRIFSLLLFCCLLTGCAQPVTPPADAPTEPATEAAAVIAPLPVTVDLNALDNCTVAVSLAQGDAYVDDTGIMRMDLIVYVYDRYDMVDISRMKVGDVIVIRGKQVTVTSLSRSDYGDILINGGLDAGGWELRTDENTVFYECGYSDAKSWYPLGAVTLPVSPDFVYTDASDPDREPAVCFPGDFLTDGVIGDYFFVPANTTVTVENGFITAMHRIYIP